MISDEQIAWTHDALAHLYSTAFLQRHGRDACVAGCFNSISGTALQQVLFQAILQFHPPPTTSPQSAAWRLSIILRLRYLEGLSQAEVADELFLSLRHIKREQQRAVEAFAAFLLECAPNELSWAPHHLNASPEPLEQAQSGEWPRASAHPAGLVVPGAISKDHRPLEIFDLEQMLRASLDVLDTALQEKNLSVNVTVSRKPHNVRANAMIVRQLLIGALNWMIHGVAERTLEMRITNDGREVVLHFQRPITGDFPETGLSTVQQLAEASASYVCVSPVDSDGSGQYLEIRLPGYEANCVLMIDDDPEMIQLVKRQLQRNDEFYLVGVTQPGAAMKQITALRPVCILLDLMMPEHDGWELLRLFKTLPESASIPVVISSVLPENDLARVLGAADVLPRPFNAAQLLATLKSVTAAANGHPPSAA